jgi:hypothetical protein
MNSGRDWDACKGMRYKSFPGAEGGAGVPHGNTRPCRLYD